MIEGLKDIGVTFYYKEKDKITKEDKIRLQHITETIDTVKKIYLMLRHCMIAQRINLSTKKWSRKRS